MMENPRPEIEEVIKYIGNLFRLNKKTNFTASKDIRNLFQLEKEKQLKAIKDRILWDIKNLFEHEKEGVNKPVRVNNVWSNNYTKYKSKTDRNKTLSVG